MIRKGRSRVTSPYGMRVHPVYGDRRMHWGKDSVGLDSDILVACGPGRVEKLGFDKERGNYVLLALGEGVVARYQHVARFLVKEGERVQAGQPLAVEGMTGTATGVHCHFEVEKDGQRGDPSPWDGMPNEAGLWENAGEPEEADREGRAVYRVYDIEAAYESRAAAVRHFGAAKKAAPAEVVLCSAGGDGKWRIGRVYMATESLELALENMTVDRILA